MIYRLDPDIVAFPNPREAEPDGLLAVGGALTVDWLLLAYSHGIFPWYAYKHSEPMWYCPHERFVIFPDEIHVSHSMRSLLRKQRYMLTFNGDFAGVLRNCSTAQQRNEHDYAWLGEDIINAYTELYERGFAASVEVWDGTTLVGGLYGVTIAGCFIGESMFSLVPSASKIALIQLANYMRLMGWKFIDCQLETPHLRSMGARYISYDEYMRILDSDMN